MFKLFKKDEMVEGELFVKGLTFEQERDAQMLISEVSERCILVKSVDIHTKERRAKFVVKTKRSTWDKLLQLSYVVACSEKVGV